MDQPFLRTIAAAAAVGLALPLLVACTPAGATARGMPAQPASTGSPRRSSVTSAAVTTPGKNPVKVVVIGDSLSTGLGTSPEHAWPSLLQSVHLSGKRPVQVTNAAENGSGYLVPGDDGDTFSTEVQAAVTPDAAVIVFFGSDNDAGTDPQELRQAVAATLAEASSLAPNAALLAVGPLSGSEEQDQTLADVRESDASAAQEAGVPFIDPIADQWFSGRTEVLLGPDGEHPSELGQEVLRDKMKEILSSVLPT